MAPPACAYCGVPGLWLLLHCETTKKYFCNCTGNPREPSHAIQHAIHKKGRNDYRSCDSDRIARFQNATGKLQCASCLSGNIFELGYVMIKNKIRLLCRQDCPSQEDDLTWKPVINANDALARVFANFEQRAMEVNSETIEILELHWAAEEELAHANVQNVFFNSGAVFPSLNVYNSHFRSYIHLEDTAMRLETSDRRTERNVTVRWLTFDARNTDRFKFRLNAPGIFKEHEKVEVSLGGWTKHGMISMSEGRLYECSLPYGPDNPRGITEGFSIKVIYDELPIERMKTALAHFCHRGSEDIVVAMLLPAVEVPIQQYDNLPISNSYHVTGLHQLNEAQVGAVTHALTYPLTLIQAPPGTGKTTVAATIAYQFASKGLRVLMCAPSNVATDHIMQTVARTPLREVVRFYSSRRRRENQNGNSLQVLRMQPNKETKVVCCTCMMAGSPRLADHDFDIVIVDECSQATEPELLIPIQHCRGRLVLIGDSRQLGPIVHSKLIVERHIITSMFERLEACHLEMNTLNIQYRMHPAISEFPLENFYEDIHIENGVTAADRALHGMNNEILREIWPINGLPIVFWNNGTSDDYRDERAGTGTTYANRHECAVLVDVLRRLLEAGADVAQISIITMYLGQREYIKYHLHRHQIGTGIEIGTVDSFQGRENEIIILSTVRSNQRFRIGFLVDERRLNVALTRAKRGLIILGDRSTLGNTPQRNDWTELVEYYEHINAITD